MSALTAPPQRNRSGRPNTGPRPPRLRPVEQTLFVLLSNPGEWFVVDRWPKSSSAMHVALHRRGCDVVSRWDGAEYVMYARWTHPVPNDVAAWDEAA